ncbi:MAG TPA: hypothetical protein VEV37_06765 [Bryobacteraceae bacterium]|nr:hypothetical protein [Bryobacteraceae bacterium]
MSRYRTVRLQPGRRRSYLSARAEFAFRYAVVAAAAVAFVMTISGVAGLFWWQRLLMLIGTVIVGWAVPVQGFGDSASRQREG